MPDKFRKLFKSREELNENINPSEELDKNFYENFYLNSWYNVPYFGKVDTKGNLVIPKEKKLRFSSFGTDSLQTQALDFVAELFKMAKRDYSKNYISGNLNKNSTYLKENLEAKRGFYTSRSIYAEKLKSIYSQFLDYIIVDNKYQKINDYRTFIEELKIFLYSRDQYFTRAGFVESKDYSPLNTGLVVEIHTANYFITSEKEKFYNDLNYGAYLEIMLRHGFLVDKEIPWRVYCDIRQNVVAKKIAELNQNAQIKFSEEDLKENVQKLFDVYYDKVLPETENDFQYFKEFMIIMESFYNSFIFQFPTYKIIGLDNCGNVITNNINKNKIKISKDVKDIYGFYLKLFFEMRKIEIRDNIEIGNFDYLVSVSLGKFEELFMQNHKKAVCEAINLFTKNIATLPYRERSLVQGGPIKGPA